MKNEFLTGVLSSLKQEIKNSSLKESKLPDLDDDLGGFIDSMSDDFSKSKDGGEVYVQNRRRTKGRTEGVTSYDLDYSAIRDKLEKIIPNKSFTIPQVETIVRLLRHEFGIGDAGDVEFLRSKLKK